jgi:hypothetical protein
MMQCVLGWAVATALFFGLVAILGGPTSNDASESFYSTWALAHGDATCVYPGQSADDYAFLPDYQAGPHIAPGWVIVSAGAAAGLRIGHSLPFPSSSAMSPNCSKAYLAMYRWAGQARTLLPTLGLGYLSWFGLLGGFVALLRASGRGRTRWEVLGVVLLSVIPVVWMPLLDEFHPQDLLAMGLALGGMACVLRGRWTSAGVLFAGAVLTHQFTLLVLVPVMVIIPSEGRRRFVASGLIAAAVVSAPLLITGSRGALSAMVFGSGDNASYGGTVLWETGIRGHPLIFFSRFLPIIIAIALAWWSRRRLGEKALDPVPFVSLLAVTLSLRIVFEQGLFGYKFLALAVMLLALDVISGRIREATVVWLALVTLAFNPVPAGLAFNARSFGTPLNRDLAAIFIGFALMVLLVEALRRRVHPWIALGVFIAVLAFGNWPLDAQRSVWPLWLWQTILVSSGVVLAATPFLRRISEEASAASRLRLAKVSQSVH